MEFSRLLEGLGAENTERGQFQENQHRAPAQSKKELDIKHKENHCGQNTKVKSDTRVGEK